MIIFLAVFIFCQNSTVSANGICIVDENASIFVADEKTLFFLCCIYCEQSLFVNSYNNADEKKLLKVMFLHQYC